MAIPPEDFEYLRRKSAATAEWIAGIVMVVASLALLVGSCATSFSSSGSSTSDVLAVMGYVLFVVGIVLIIHGRHVAGKISHIVWTKQALREYEQSKAKIIASEAQLQASELKDRSNRPAELEDITYRCPYCDDQVSATDRFCIHCGKELSPPGNLS
jgi:hypothetical protein